MEVPMKEYEIYQLKDSATSSNLLFLSSTELESTKHTANAERYNMVYHGEMTPTMNLDSIYVQFNVDHPADFRGHSLSVSDVIVVRDEKETRAYYVDSFGFKPIPNFFDPLMSIREATAAEQDFTYTQDTDLMRTAGCIGHLRVDMGRDGKEFHSSWDFHNPDLTSADFAPDFNAIIDAMRVKNSAIGILADRTALGKYCYAHEQARLPDGDNSYAFRVDMEQYALMLRLTPNRGEYNAYAYVYRREDLDRVLFPLEHAQEQPEKQFPPVYRHTGSFARQAGEIEAYRNSMKENCACRDAIDQTIRENFDGLRLNAGIERKILDTFGPERVTWVLANTIMQREHDGRFSLNNRAWAQAVQIPIDRTEGGIVRNDHFVLSSHSAVLDGFVNAARKEMAADLEKGKYLKEQNARPSVRAALQDKQQTAKNADKKPEQSSKKSRQIGIE